jgi:FlaA1/EpsC-like NDP-sugar epimerase
MAIPEAVSLVLLSWVVGQNGQVLLLDMGTPSRILDLAIRLIKMHGLEPYTDIPIREIGLRPGEKIHEELTYDTTKLTPAPAKRVFVAEDLSS